MSDIFSALFLFLTAVSVDSLTAGMPYGAGRVRIRPLSCLVLVCVPAAFIAVAGRVGSYLFLFLPRSILPLLSFFLLLLLGLSKLAESLIRSLARRRPSLIGHWGCKIKQLHIVFTVYLCPEDANREDPQILSPKEALLLSLALSLDSILAGMAFQPAPIPPITLFFAAALFNLLFFSLGYGLGYLLRTALHVDLSWFSGLCLLFLAFHTLL